MSRGGRRRLKYDWEAHRKYVEEHPDWLSVNAWTPKDVFANSVIAPPEPEPDAVRTQRLDRSAEIRKAVHTYLAQVRGVIQ